MPVQERYINLLKEAKKAASNAYAPYSSLSVGAAVLLEDGKIFTGVNVENFSYALIMCAERVAIGNAISSGRKDIVAIAIYADKREISPCHLCRHFILEFGPHIDIVYQKNGEIVSSSIKELTSRFSYYSLLYPFFLLFIFYQLPGSLFVRGGGFVFSLALGFLLIQWRKKKRPI